MPGCAGGHTRAEQCEIDWNRRGCDGRFHSGCRVSAHNVGTGIVNETVSNETGAYQFANLQTGTYEVRAELPGFQTQRFTNVILGVGQQVRLNVTLTVANVATTVEVTTVADTALATTSGSIATVLPDTSIRELPLGDRNVLALLSGMAGTGATRSLGLNLDSTGFGGDGYFAGNRLNAVNVTLDGLTVSAGRYDQGVLGVTYMSPDLIEEVRVTTANVDASASRGSGQMQMVSRSGTNQFRGSAFWNNRNSALSSANWFNNFNSVKKDYENRNQYGVRLGGPVDGEHDEWEECLAHKPEKRHDILRRYPACRQSPLQTGSGSI